MRSRRQGISTATRRAIWPSLSLACAARWKSSMSGGGYGWRNPAEAEAGTVIAQPPTGGCRELVQSFISGMGNPDRRAGDCRLQARCAAGVDRHRSAGVARRRHHRVGDTLETAHLAASCAPAAVRSTRRDAALQARAQKQKSRREPALDFVSLTGDCYSLASIFVMAAMAASVVML